MSLLGWLLLAHAGPRALVYPNNPVVDEAPVEVALRAETGLLSDDRLEVFQCVDQGETRPTPLPSGELVPLHVCTPVPVSVGEVPAAAEPWPEDPVRSEDDFVAANVYWNLHRGLDAFDALGWVVPETYDARAEVLVDYRETDRRVGVATDPDGVLLGFDQAYHGPGMGDPATSWRAPTLVFGQGRHADFGYDADVVLHELAHLVIGSTRSLMTSPDTDYGPSVEAPALNEALADYFSAAIQGDPVMGEYVLASGAPKRDLSEALSCVDALWGESHRDGLPFVQGLWSVREGLEPVDRDTLDRTVLAQIPVLGSESSFDRAHDVLLSAVFDALGPDVGEALTVAWLDRGVDRCRPVHEVAPDAGVFLPLTKIGAFSGSEHVDRVPGAVQFRVEVAEPGSLVTVFATQREWLGLDLDGKAEPMPVEVVGGFGERITWSHERVAGEIEVGGIAHEVERVDWQPDLGSLGWLTRVASGPDPDMPDHRIDHLYELELEVDQAGVLVFQFANDATREVRLEDVGVLVRGPEERRACGCASSEPAGWLALPLMVLLVRRPRPG